MDCSSHVLQSTRVDEGCSTRLLHHDDPDDNPDPRTHRVRTILPRVPCVTTESLRPDRYWSLISPEAGTHIPGFVNLTSAVFDARLVKLPI
ncbi:hypothetical protein H9Q72_007441 [Fusarium xylarioides]|uniref:Uncharacterized protein n=1 Tax=Fusarium xylarioides TaxID=221167 RepID=A0A9P7HPV9_9HYPO|nr:hypothetical protein H9Q70_003879 [Fusarium xylarioides]KAG5764471.1 hypothetical protein H9Q72_007441 [Fusarium xylarioides]KAG5784068.1 hypothetical protein H9Q73_002267 [Fusarium xylarioides]KAG5828220.1 hypothetical protein H9Q74_001688 [Fusarium xylarioides]